MKRAMDMVVLQLPRGCTAIAWVDCLAGSVMTEHAWLAGTLAKGIKGWEGRVLFPADGRLFLAALL